MSQTPVIPWSPERLQELDSDELDGLARGAGRTLVVGRLVIGRCMLEMDRRDLAGQWGFSGSVHYAVRVLKISRKVARDARRVADALQALPLLTRAAEAGEIGWAHLREAVRVATPETEEAWLDATELPWTRFWRLVKAADPGDLPGEGKAEVQTSEESELRIRLCEDRRDLMQAAMARLARSLGRLLPVEEALDYAWAEILNGPESGFDKKLEKAQKLLEELRELREREEKREAERALRKAKRAKRRAPRTAAKAAAAGGPTRAGSDEPGVETAGAGAEAVAVAESGPARAAAAEPAAVAESGPARAAAAEPGVEAVSGPTRAHEEPLERPAGRVADRVAADVPRPPFAYPAPVSDGADVIRDWEAPYGEDMSPPWEMVSATAVPFPEAPDVRLTVPEPKPFWECQDGCCTHPPANREARRAAAVERGAGTRRGSAETRRTVLRRDRFRCLCPDCPNSIWLHLHHLTMYCLGGASIPKNEIALCSRCHRNAHKGRLRIRGNPEDGLEWLDGSGRPLGEASAEVLRRSDDSAREILAAMGV